jgi:RNA-binding protein
MDSTEFDGITPGALSGKQRRHLRALGHGLHAVVQAGKNGLTDELLQAVDAALLQHELIKLKVQRECPADCDELARELGAQVGARVAQVLGRTVLLYRRHPAEPRIQLPR